MELESKVKEKLGGLEKEGEGEVPPAEIKKRPKSAYALFLVDQKDKTMDQFPGIEMDKFNKMTAYKWKKLSEDQRKIYENKFQELLKLYEEQDRQKDTE